MRILLAIITLAALGWTGWWFAISTAQGRALEAWLADRRADGWVAEAREIDVGGFPYRVDTTLRGLDLANPDDGWAWSAPQFQLVSLAYQPNQLIAIWPDAQIFATPIGAADIRSETMRGSVVVEPTARLALRRATIDIEGLTLSGDGAWEIAAAKAIFATRQSEGADAPPFSHDIAFTADGLALPPSWTRSIDRAGVLAPVIETARFEGRATFDRPWDRPAIEEGHPALEALEINDMTFTWGKLDLRGKGALTADTRGFADGRIDLRARNWRDMLDLAEDAGAVAPGVASALRGGLGLIARLGGDAKTLEVPLDFSGGFTRLGPVPIGPAPRLIER